MAAHGRGRIVEFRDRPAAGVRSGLTRARTLLMEGPVPRESIRLRDRLRETTVDNPSAPRSSQRPSKSVWLRSGRPHGMAVAAAGADAAVEPTQARTFVAAKREPSYSRASRQLQHMFETVVCVLR